MKAKILTLENPLAVMRVVATAMLIYIASIGAFAQTTVVDIVVNSKDHSTLEAAVIAAELADDLSGEGPFTVFAPSDAAFAALPEGSVEALLEDPSGALADILLYHVVGSKALSSDLSEGQMIKTLNGAEISVTFKDGKAYIDNALVTVADIKADNGVVHVIDAVIMPSSTLADASSPAKSEAAQGCGK